jgi:ankyrin repeat domain-containing protein 50
MDLAGAGKTFLTSTVISHLQDLCEQSFQREGFAFFYCSRRGVKERRETVGILQSYVRQLSTPANKPEAIRNDLRVLYVKSISAGFTLGREECKKQLLESVNLATKTTMVLDALDECEPSPRRELMDVVDYLLSNSKKPLKIFIASRPYDDIRRRLLSKPYISIGTDDNEDDIRKYIQEQMDKHIEVWEGLSEELQNRIFRVLLKGASGM